MVSAVSDIVLNYFSKQNNANATLKSLRPYYNKYGDILSPILAGVTVIVVYLINVALFQIIIKTLSKSHVKMIERSGRNITIFLFLAVILGILADILIHNLHVFGNSLDQYYKRPFSYGWGFVSYLFALAITTVILKIVDMVINKGIVN
jgi:hypothetical protein